MLHSEGALSRKEGEGRTSSFPRPGLSLGLAPAAEFGLSRAGWRGPSLQVLQLSPFRYFKTSPEIIRLAVTLYAGFPLSLRNVEDLLHERGVEMSLEAVRHWWHRFGPIFAAKTGQRRVQGMRSSRWHLDEMLVKINGQRPYLWRAADHEGDAVENFVTKTRDRKAALKFLGKAMKKHGQPEAIVTDRLRTCRPALRDLGAADRQVTGPWLNNRVVN